MGELIEMDIFLRKTNFSFQQLFSLLAREGLQVSSIEHMSIFDDWQYTNEVHLEPSVIDLDASDIFLQKFTLMHFTVNQKYRCSLITSLEDNCLDLSFGLQINDLAPPDDCDIDDYIQTLYDKTTDINKQMDEQPFHDDFIAASMGVEFVANFHNDLKAMVTNEHSGSRWVLPKRTGKNIVLDRFT